MDVSFGRALPVIVALLFAASPSVKAAADDDVVLIQFLASTGEDPDGKAKVRWRDKGDALDFQVELEDMDAGSYELFIGGTTRGQIAVDGLGQGEIEFKTPLDTPKPLFDFEVFDQAIEVKQGDTVFFTDTFDPGGTTGGGGGGGKKPTKTEIFMVNVGPDANAKGRIRYEEKNGRTRFKVTVENLDAGTYSLAVGGTLRASFETAGLHEVELDFRDPPDDDPGNEPGELHFTLDFAPLGQLVEIVQGPVTFLQGMLPGAGASNAPKKGKQAAKDIGKKNGDALQVALMDLGVLAGAQGHVTLEQTGETELEVEIEDLPDDDYGFCVGGLGEGVLTVIDGKGKLKFSQAPEVGELLLDFAVKGVLLEVKLGVDPILATIFPVSVPAALGQGVAEKHTDSKVRVNLVNAGVDLDTTGVARWKRSKSGKERLVIRIAELPAADYTLRVDGVPRGTLTVQKDEGRGRLVFDASGKGKKSLLDFPVFGTSIEVVDNAAKVVLEASID